jgi:hypothetical protein
MKSIPNFSEKDMLRFLAKVDQSKGIDSCWLWTAGGTCQGYGTFRIGAKTYLAPRVAFEWLGNKTIPDGLQVLHNCDTPACVNPKCLFLGTNDDNVQDRVAKGRSAHNCPGLGEENNNAKYSDEQIACMFILRDSGQTQDRIASEFGTTQGNISRILTGKRRSSSTLATRQPSRPCKVNRLTPDKIALIHEMSVSGHKNTFIAKEVGCSAVYVGMILNGKRRI